MTTLSYFLELDKRKTGEIRKILSNLYSLFTIAAIDKGILDDALHSEVKDYEDAVLECTAVKFKLDYIVTRNLKDFAKSRVDAVTPLIFLESLE